MEKKTMNILAAATGVVVGYFLFCKFTKQSGAKSLEDATQMGEEDLGEEETPASGSGGGGGMFGGSTPTPVMGSPVFQNYPAPLPPITINTPPPIVYSQNTFGTSPANTTVTKDVPIVTATKDVPITNTSPVEITKPMVSNITNPITAAKFSGFMEFDGNDKFMSELL